MKGHTKSQNDLKPKSKDMQKINISTKKNPGICRDFFNVLLQVIFKNRCFI